MKPISAGTSGQLNALLDKAIELDKADLGNIQLFNAESKTLEIIAQKGFQPEFLNYFKVVKAFDTSACGRAIAIGSPVIIPDITRDIAYAKHTSIAKAAGYISVKSVPIYDEAHRLLGVISTHCNRPRAKWDMNVLDGLLCELGGLMDSEIV
jgi:GAF domain-containing protein